MKKYYIFSLLVVTIIMLSGCNQDIPILEYGEPEVIIDSYVIEKGEYITLKINLKNIKGEPGNFKITASIADLPVQILERKIIEYIKENEKKYISWNVIENDGNKYLLSISIYSRVNDTEEWILTDRIRLN